MFILWFSVGMWHGGSWNYIIGSGLLHWGYIVGGQLLEPVFQILTIKFRINKEKKWIQIFQMLRTFILVCIGFVFFRAGSFIRGLKILRSTFVFDFSLSKMKAFLEILGEKDLFMAFCAIMILLTVSIMKEKMEIRQFIAKQPLIIRWSIYYILIFTVLVFGMYGPDYSASEFIYENF